MPDHTLDTLAEFHMQNPDAAGYALIAHLITVLETHKQQDIESAWRNVTNILHEAEATRLLHLMCQIDHVDYLQLMQDCQTVTAKHISPTLLLILAILPVPYVASKLEIDYYWAGKLLDQFHKHFTIDDPIQWLKCFLSTTEKERVRYHDAKHDLLMGRAVTSTPIDTAEDRRINRWHRLIPRPPRSEPD